MMSLLFSTFLYTSSPMSHTKFETKWFDILLPYPNILCMYSEEQNQWNSWGAGFVYMKLQDEKNINLGNISSAHNYENTSGESMCNTFDQDKTTGDIFLKGVVFQAEGSFIIETGCMMNTTAPYTILDAQKVKYDRGAMVDLTMKSPFPPRTALKVISYVPTEQEELAWEVDEVTAQTEARKRCAELVPGSIPLSKTE
jgi:hypothetical protein